MPLAFVRWLLTSLVLTELIELALARLAFGMTSRDDMVTVALAQVVTNPAVQLLTLFVGWDFASTSIAGPFGVVLLAEAAAFVAEALLYRVAGMRRPWLTSAALNAASFAIGLALVALGLL